MVHIDVEQHKEAEIAGPINKVSLLCILGHSGEIENETHDVLAKVGSAAPFIGPEPIYGIGTEWKHIKRTALTNQDEYCFCNDREKSPIAIHHLLDCAALRKRRLCCLGAYQLEKRKLLKLERRNFLNFINVLGLDEVL